MKKTMFFLVFVLMVINIFSVRNWQMYTNRTHVYDMLEIDNKIYMGTWGGLEIFDLETDSFVKTYTTRDGLQDLDIRSISYQEETETLLLGTIKRGVNRLQDDNFLIALNEVIGLPVNRINVVVNSDSLIYVATDQGVTVFKDVENFPYPLPINHYATHNGLPSDRVIAMTLSDNGYLLCGTDNGLSYVHTTEMFDVTAWQHFNASNSLLPDNRINSVSENNNKFAIATRNGLVRISEINDQDSWHIYNRENDYPFIVSNEILTAFIDSEENIWFSYGIWNENLLNIDYPPFNPQTDPVIDFTPRYAIKMISPTHLFTIWERNQDGITTHDIKGFIEINYMIYAYTWGLGFFYFENGIWHNRLPNTIVANNITDMTVDLNNKIWISNGYIGGSVNRKGTRGVSGFDGLTWTNFRAESSSLNINRIFRTATDARNRKWFGGWGGGLSVYDEEQSAWYYLNANNGLAGNVIGAIAPDKDGNIWVSNYTGGVFIYDIDAIEEPGNITSLRFFHIYDADLDDYDSDVIAIHHTEDKVFFGCRYSGIRYWDDPSFPQTHQPGDHWVRPPVVTNTYIYGIDSRSTFFGEEVWIAAESGLYMFETNTERWYRYGTSIKREVWLSNRWQRDRLYFIDEERLYGAAPTFPTAILIDPFDRIWIGTEANGLTVYDITTDRYTLYNMDNTPLISNKITSLSYEPYSGLLYVGTDEALHTVEIGRLYKSDDLVLGSTIAYPNPFKPDEGQILTIANQDNTIMPQGKNQCRIYNKNGELVITLEEDRFFRFSWDGRNSSGRNCSSGIYFYVVSAESGEVSRGTIALIR